MKSMRLNNLDINSLKYRQLIKIKNKKFFKDTGIITPKGRTENTIRYIVTKAYENLPKNLKDFSKGWKDSTIKYTTLSIMNSGEDGEIEPYKAMLKAISDTYSNSWEGTKRDIYKQFKDQYPSLYSKYNTYVYRLGYSSAKYFYDNVDIEKRTGSIYTLKVKLPFKLQKNDRTIIYDELVIIYNYSGPSMTATMQ